MFRHSREIKWVRFKLFQEENKKYMQKIEYKRKHIIIVEKDRG